MKRKTKQNVVKFFNKLLFYSIVFGGIFIVFLIFSVIFKLAVLKLLAGIHIFIIIAFVLVVLVSVFALLFFGNDEG